MLIQSCAVNQIDSGAQSPNIIDFYGGVLEGIINILTNRNKVKLSLTCGSVGNENVHRQVTRSPVQPHFAEIDAEMLCSCRAPINKPSQSQISNRQSDILIICVAMKNHT